MTELTLKLQSALTGFFRALLSQIELYGELLVSMNHRGSQKTFAPVDE